MDKSGKILYFKTQENTIIPIDYCLLQKSPTIQKWMYFWQTGIFTRNFIALPEIPNEQFYKIINWLKCQKKNAFIKLETPLNKIKISTADLNLFKNNTLDDYDYSILNAIQILGINRLILIAQKMFIKEANKIGERCDKRIEIMQNTIDYLQKDYNGILSDSDSRESSTSSFHTASTGSFL
ncbi:uncharacterized protein LOC119689418 [Teleopsis dalmanni]|uniref:uncharacterized protein LOC119689418 n=1 Tax=Teleopsis dalmanni TaxID=139649 RepID=UPI0018CF8C74|nr:uncharacterized protein LOC119689418 [Teleopsis dalmanni]XP_037960172.1 uncharacterized protein LOC119689418 [Teleopsis dalmanni]